MTTTHTTVDNGVNVEALLGARAGLGRRRPRSPQFQWRATVSRGSTAPTAARPMDDLLRARRRAVAPQDDVHLSTSTIHSHLRLAGQRHHPGRDTCSVALGGCLTAGIAVGRPAPQAFSCARCTATLEGDDGPPGHPRHRRRRAQRLRRGITVTLQDRRRRNARSTSRRSSRNRRSARRSTTSSPTRPPSRVDVS